MLYDPGNLPTPWTIRENIARHVVGANVVPLIPRLELGGLGQLEIDEVHIEAEIGRWALGIYKGVPDELWAFMQSNEPYSSRLNGIKRRNFHFVPVRFADLPFARMTDRLRELLSFAYDRTTGRDRPALRKATSKHRELF